MPEFFVVLARVYFYRGVNALSIEALWSFLPLLRHLFFIDFASYGCPVININQVTLVPFIFSTILTNMKDQNKLHNVVHKYMYTLTFTGQRPLGEICLSISLPPTKIVDKKARRGSIQTTNNE